ncbi:MAG: hypothetical protein JWQ11_164 [Rhizobacter sp.]|nr:hypothetical protein [Rhizobacter sp.]
MVALAIGLVVIASAGIAMADLVRSAARTLMVTRVDQDLRIAVDLIAGELRRAGYWQNAGRALGTGGAAGTTLLRNPYQAMSVGPAGEVSYSQSRDVENDVVDSNESFGFRLRASAIEYRLGGSGWQSLTDASVVAVTRLSIGPSTSVQWFTDSCTATCSPGAPTTVLPSCPSLTLRRFDLVLQAHAVADPNLVRDVALSVRARNDALEGGC